MLYEVITYAGAKVLTGIVKHDKIDKTPKTVEFIPQDIDKMLGITVSEEDMKVELNRLDFRITSYNVCYTKLLRV